MSTSPSVRLAVLGTGAITQVVHLPVLSRMRGVEVAGLYDSDRSKARTLADRFGVPRVYATAGELWDDPEIDGVVLATPSNLHAEGVRAGLESGKYVFCEKPLALHAAGAREVLATEGADNRLMVGMNQRFRPDAAALKSFVAGGELGDVFYVRSGWLSRRAPRARRTWRQQKSGAGGGVLMDLGIQMLDLSMWLLGYPAAERVVAHLKRAPGSEVEDSAVLLLFLEGDRVVNLEVTWNLLSQRERQYLHLAGLGGSGSLGPIKVYKEMESGLMDVTPQIQPGRENQFTASYRQELATFADAIREGRALGAPTEQVALLEIVEAAYRSAEEGTEVLLRGWQGEKVTR
ncbi:MAG TPA: Gfo/Idh/MocA family oxidoreductase [Longimicrobiaceae bacterium]|nr:Gfo/Idh/MocA family oxidoreductase [Longimicrobiaceae bacterium]